MQNKNQHKILWKALYFYGLEPSINNFIVLTVLMFYFLRQIKKFHLFNQHIFYFYDGLESFIFLINILEICLSFLLSSLCYDIQNSSQDFKLTTKIF